MSGQRLESLVQVLILLVIGGMAGAASFTHVHDVAVAHGQPDWIGWADAVVVELMSIALGLELRRRARTNAPTAFVVSALVFFVIVSLAAQVVDAERSVIGWIAAALPAIGFLVLVKIVLSRTVATAKTGATTNDVTDVPAQAAPATDQPATATTRPTPATVNVKPAADERHDQADELVDEQLAEPVPVLVESTDLVPETIATTVEAPAHLLPAARFAVVQFEQSTGRPITAEELAARLTISPAVAGQLLHAVTDDHDRVNGSLPMGRR